MAEYPTLADMAALLARLAVAFGRQKEHASEGENAARVYLDACRDLTLADLERGVDRCIREDKFWPRPARVRAAAIQSRPFVPTRPTLDDGDRCREGHPYRVREYVNAAGRNLGGRPWCPCEERAAAVYGVVWGRELRHEPLPGTRAGRWVPVP